MNIKDKVKRRVDDLCGQPYSEIVKLIDDDSITETVVDNQGNKYQMEISIIWDDKSKGVIRVAAFLDSDHKRWWNSFFSKSLYERLIEPK